MKEPDARRDTLIDATFTLGLVTFSVGALWLHLAWGLVAIGCLLQVISLLSLRLHRDDHETIHKKR